MHYQALHFYNIMCLHKTEQIGHMMLSLGQASYNTPQDRGALVGPFMVSKLLAPIRVSLGAELWEG